MARKVIPEDVREVFGKREAKRAWPATLSEAEAKWPAAGLVDRQLS